MKAALKQKIERLRDGADEAREHAAKQLYQLDAIVSAMAREASKGYRALKVSPPLPMNLSKTKAAAELIEQLTEAGVSADWSPRQPSDASAGEVFFDLVIRW